MSGFIDAAPSRKLSTFGFQATPAFSTNITAGSSGSERRQANWYQPLHRYVAPGAVDCIDTMLEIKDMWMALLGPAYSFPFRDPSDMASRPVQRANTEPTIDAGDQLLGTGDGVTREFQLRKSYTFGTRTVWRPVYLPVLSTVEVAIDAVVVDPGLYSVSRYGGIVNFDTAPANAEVVTAGFVFDVEVRFEDDSAYQQIVTAFGVQGAADLSFLEIRPCVSGS